MRIVTMRRYAWAAALAASAAACQQAEPENTLRVSGHVEATEVQIAPEVGGRIVELRVQEGDRVARGDLIARLDTRDIELQIERARTERVTAAAQLRLLEAGSRAEEIRRAQAQADASSAEVAAAAAELKSAETDLARFETLLSANAGSQKQRDDARARVDVARERERAARDRVRAAGEEVARLQAGARREELDVARARIRSAEAQIAVLEKSLGDANVTAPVAGVVTQTLADAGEIVPPRAPIVVVTDLDNAWANLFVPEPMVPRVKLGQPATVLTDAGGEGMPGKVSYVSPRAEFTPRNVQTADERSRLVYRIKVTVDNRSGVLKSGMPVDAILELQ
jgi:HlyD family secretion protein